MYFKLHSYLWLLLGCHIMFLKHWFPIYVFCTMCSESRSIRFLRQSPYDKPFLVVLPFNIHCLLDFLKYLSWLNFLIVLLVGILPNFTPLLFPSNAVSCLSVNSSKMRKVQYLCLWLALHLNHVALLVDHTTHPNGSFHLLANVCKKWRRCQIWQEVTPPTFL